MTPGRPLSGLDIRALVGEVADALDPNGDPRYTVVLVGGSLLAWRGLRASTADVDSVRPITEELAAAVVSVAQAHDLASDWLNANAAAFLPATFNPDGCDVLLDAPRLVVLGAPLRDVFLMKLYRADPNDVADLIVLWPHVGFASASEVVDAFAAAYPHAPHDEHLDQLVIEIAARAGDNIQPA